MDNNELEKLKLKTDLIYKKLLIFSAIAGGSWIYGTKLSNSFISFLLFGFFIFVAIGIAINILKLNAIEKELS
jgi:hypothetical protein